VTVRSADNGVLVLEGACPVEDAETLLQLLQTRPTAGLDWTQCRQLHTAVLQVVLASGLIPLGPCGDPFVESWLALKRNQKDSSPGFDLRVPRWNN
jgi:hypothetical protein